MKSCVKFLALSGLLASLTAVGSTRNLASPSNDARRFGYESIYAGAKAAAEDTALVEKGKALYSDYKCYECHGKTGKGTDDAPDLTDSILNEDEVSVFLQKTSADADAKGMPRIPADSPDLKPLVAFVMSLRQPPPKP